MVYPNFQSAALALAVISCASAQSLHEVPWAGHAYPENLSNVGGTLVGWGYLPSTNITRGYRWTPGGTLLNFGVLANQDPTITSSYALEVSDDGSVVGGMIATWSGVQAFVWRADSGLGPQTIPMMATPTGVTGSGNTIVGDALSQYGNGFVIWNSTAGSTFVPAPPVAHPTGLVTGAISRDGAVVVGSVGLGTNRQGHDTRQAFLWHTSTGRYELLDHPSPTCYFCDVSVVSDNGSAMCGVRYDYALNDGYRTPYRWTSSSGFTDLAVLPELGSGDYYPTGIDGAGSIVVGFFYNGPSSVGVIWDEKGAIHRAESYFAELGLELPGWVIFSLRDVSADGRFYSGMGIRPPAQMVTSFIIDLGPDCDSDGIRDHIEISQGAADFNRNDVPDTCECIADLFRNGSIDGADLAIMLSQWGPASASTVSDLNGDGSVGGVDLAALLASWGSCTN